MRSSTKRLNLNPINTDEYRLCPISSVVTSLMTSGLRFNLFVLEQVFSYRITRLNRKRLNLNPINMDEYRLWIVVYSVIFARNSVHQFKGIVGVLWSLCLVRHPTPPFSCNCRYPLILLSCQHPTPFLELSVSFDPFVLSTPHPFPGITLLELPLPFPGITLPGWCHWWRHIFRNYPWMTSLMTSLMTSFWTLTPPHPAYQYWLF